MAKKIQTAPTPTGAYSESTGDRYLYYPITGLTPSTYTTALYDADRGRIERWMELNEEIEDRDARIAQCLEARRAAVIACKYDIEPWRSRDAIKSRSAAAAEDTKIADAVRDALLELPCFESRLVNWLDATMKGVAFTEIRWARGTGDVRWTIEDLIWVPARKFTYYDSLVPRLLTDEDPSEGEALRSMDGSGTGLGYWVVHCPQHRSVEPYRSGLGRVLGWYFMFKHTNVRDWLTYLETHAHPLRLGFYAPGATEAVKSAMWQALQYMSTDQAALLEKREGEDDPVKVIYPDSTNAVEAYARLVEYCDREITLCVNGQTLTSYTDGKGSYAQAEVHAQTRDILLAADADAISTTIRQQIIYPFVYFNFGADAAKRLPWYRIYYERSEDLEAAARWHGTLAQQVGVTFSMAQIRERFGLDAPKDDEDAVAYKPTGVPAGEPTPPEGEGAEPPAGEPLPPKAESEAKPPEGETPPAEEAAAKHDAVDVVALADDPDEERPTEAPPAAILGVIGFKLPKPVASAVKEYAAVVDGFNRVAFANTMERVTKYLVRAPAGWGDGEEFAAQFTKWWEKAWRQYWGADGISQGTLYPFINKMYRYYKTADRSVTGVVGTSTATDTRVVNFLTRADKWYFSSFVENASFRGPMQKFLIDQYAIHGGKLFGPKSADIIAGFKKAAVKEAHNLSAYEVDRILRTGVNRARNWAGVQQMADAGIQRAEVVCMPSACNYCKAMEGQVIDVATESAWIDKALAADDETFVGMLEDSQDRRRNGIDAGLPPHEIIGAGGDAPALHANCRCRLVMA